MATNFKKSKNLGPVRLNLSNKGIGVSTGVKGFRVSKGADGKVRRTISIPGTGIRKTKVISNSKIENNKHRSILISLLLFPLTVAWALFKGIFLGVFLGLVRGGKSKKKNIRR
ncbi:DUF4236 domain-containing protein [Hathewaya histolytica]|uniref:DUF4236 domain-containing protein n=1 Tax=Hathewaya histolytica TaxID=1498 RepID=UPI003B679DBE